MLLAAAVHLAALPMRVDAVLWLVGIEWAALLAWAAWRRPSDGDCALCIDRHLGGASAFTTLLDPGPDRQTAAHAQALRWLERWVAAQVPGVVRSLEQRPSVRVARPLTAWGVCTALALLVLSVPDVKPTVARRASAGQALASGDSSTPSIEVPVAAQLASEIASALRSTESTSIAERPPAGGTPTADPARRGVDNASPTAALSTATLPADASPSQANPRSLVAVDGASAAQGRPAGTVSGHDAGDSPDTRAEVGVSRAVAGTIAQPRSASTSRVAGAERQIDMEQAASFDDGASARGGASSGAVVEVPAASPPRAAASMRLSVVETGYVEAWMKATGRSR